MINVGTFASSGGGVAYDSDAQAFFTASGVTDLTQKSAVNQLVLDLKSNSLWSKIKALYPIVGGNATTHSYNLVNTSLFQLSFSSGWTHSSTGMLPSVSYANTNLIPNSVLSSSSNHFGIYSRSNLVGGNYASSGCSETGSALQLSLRRFDSLAYYSVPNDSSPNNTALASAQTNSAGLYLGSRRSTTDIVLYRNSTNIASNTNTMVGSVLPSYPIFLSAINTIGTPNGATYDNKEIAFCTIGDGLTNTDLTNYYNIINTFQTSLGRNV